METRTRLGLNRKSYWVPVRSRFADSLPPLWLEEYLENEWPLCEYYFPSSYTQACEPVTSGSETDT